MTDFSTGGLTFNSAFISENDTTLPNGIGSPCGQSPIFTGEDGVRYYVVGGVGGAGGDADTLTIANADTGAAAITKTKTQMDADCVTAFGQSFMDNQIGNTFSTLTGALAVSIPDTPYLAIIVGSAGGVDVSKAILYYKVNAASALEVVAGYSGQEDSLDTQFRPIDSFGISCAGAGHIISSALRTQDASRVGIGYEYPIAVTMFGETMSTIWVLPSINWLAANGPIIETVSDNVQADKEIDLNGTYGDSIFNLGDTPTAVPNSNRSFFLPAAVDGSFMCQMFYMSDVEAFVAGTETEPNTYMDTNANVYQTGFISGVPVNLSVDMGESLGFTSALGTNVIAFHTKFRQSDSSAAYPFPDFNKKFDGSSSTADNSYYTQPTVLPFNTNDASDGWFIFAPHIFKDAGDEDKMGLRIFWWNPSTEEAILLDYKQGQMYTIGSETTAGIVAEASNVSWDRTTGKVTMLIRTARAGGSGLIVADFGTFIPNSGGAIDSEDLRLRAWTFDLDGHSFYVLRLGQQGTFLYDILTGQWSKWQTGALPVWNMAYGVPVWNGLPTAGSLSDGTIYQVDPTADLDEGTTSITRTVTGIVPHRERDPLLMGELRVTASVGDPDVDGADLSISYSDDQGQTYSTPVVVDLLTGDTDQVIRFRSLGRVQSPGRYINITDVGGVVRIDGCDVELKGQGSGG